MKLETRTVRVGEKLGPIDWAFDFHTLGWDRKGAMNPEYLRRCVEMLRQLDAGIAQGERWDATTDGGVPRVGWGEVRDIGMWDGWPFWRPMPSVWIASYLGGSWHYFGALSEIRPHNDAS